MGVGSGCTGQWQHNWWMMAGGSSTLVSSISFPYFFGGICIVHMGMSQNEVTFFGLKST